MYGYAGREHKTLNLSQPILTIRFYKFLQIFDSKAGIKANILIYLFLLLGLSFSSCGKKAPPVSSIKSIPKAISDLKAFARGKEIILVFTRPKDVEYGKISGFKILRREKKKEDCEGCPNRFVLLEDLFYEMPEKATLKDNKIIYFDRDIKYGVTYLYQVVSYTEREIYSDISNIAKVDCGMPFLPPRGLTAIEGDKKVILSWLEPAFLLDGKESKDIYGYNIYRSKKKEDIPLIPLNKKVNKKPFYEDTEVLNETPYYYKICTLRMFKDTLVEGQLTYEIRVVPTSAFIPKAPLHLICIQKEEGVLLVWEETEEENILGYNIYRRAYNENEYKRINIETVEKIKYMDKEIESGKEYFYRITAVNNLPEQNESPMSEEIKIYILE